MSEPISDPTNGLIEQLGRFLGGFFKVIVRLVFVLVLAVALGAGLYFGITRAIPALDRAYLEPVRQNSAAIGGLAARATQSASQYATQIASLQERLTALEVQNDSDSISLNEMESQLATLMPLLESDVERSAGLESAQAAIATLSADLSDLQADSNSEGQLVKERLDALGEELEAVQETLSANDFPVAQAYADLQLAKVLTRLIRVQVFLFQDNAGLAEDELSAARDMLLAYQRDPTFVGLDLQPVVARLDLALANLPDLPERALSDVGIAWELLLEGLQAPGEDSLDGAQATATPTVTPTAGP